MGKNLLDDREGSVHKKSPPRPFDSASRVQRVQGDFRSASANIDTVDMQVHTREFPSVSPPRVQLMPDSSGFSDINVGKQGSHSLNAELHSRLGCSRMRLLKIESYIFRKVEQRRGTREREIYFASSNGLREYKIAWIFFVITIVYHVGSS